MSATKHPVEPGANASPIHHEADIGSGERTPAQQETDEMIRQIPPLPRDGKGNQQKDGQVGTQQSAEPQTPSKG